MPLSDEDARYGAAYRVLYERLDPDGCMLSVRLFAIEASCRKIVEWADAQSPEVAEAYRRAIFGRPGAPGRPEEKGIIQRATDRLENNARGIQLAEAYGTMPVPPDDVLS